MDSVPLIEATRFFATDRIQDVAVADPWIAATTGDDGLHLWHIVESRPARHPANRGLTGPLVIAGGRVFTGRFRAGPVRGDAPLGFEPFGPADAPDRPPSPGLADASPPHFALATARKLYLVTAGGTLYRRDLKGDDAMAGEAPDEVPRSPYGRYASDDLAVIGIGPMPKGVAVLCRHAARSETNLDMLHDDPARPLARATVLKDRDHSAVLSGPAVHARKAYILCRERGILLSIHLHRPELREEWPAEAFRTGTGAGEGGAGGDRMGGDGTPGDEPRSAADVLLAADGEGRVLAADGRGLHALAGPGAPAFHPYPDGPSGAGAMDAVHPTRLVAHERFALIATREGRLFGLEHPGHSS